MLEAVHTDLVFTISLKRSTQNLLLSTSSPADYPIFRSEADIVKRLPGCIPREGGNPVVTGIAAKALALQLLDYPLSTFALRASVDSNPPKLAERA